MSVAPYSDEKWDEKNNQWNNPKHDSSPWIVVAHDRSNDYP
jgi:hypothetical protein